MRVRPLTPADCAAVAAIDAADPSPWSAAQIMAELTDPTRVCLGGEDGAGDLTGFVIMAAAADEAEILRIAVRRDARRRGAGLALLRAAMREAARGGAATVFLEVREGNRAAMDLYGKNGFTVIGRRRGYYRTPREDAIRMAARADRGDEQDRR